MKNDKPLIGAGIFAAFAASLCCITPVLAMLAGVSGLASTFAWLEPFRPYFVGLTVVILALVWYQKLWPKKQINCKCENDEKPKFIHTRLFLGIVTGFVFIMLAFPYYAHIFYPKAEKTISALDNSSIQTMEFTISGMTCNGCAAYVNYEINKLDGIVSLSASYEKGNVWVSFNNAEVSIDEIEKAITSTGYKVTDRRAK